MKSQPGNDSQLMQRATISKNLKERADANRSYGTNDFEAWVDSLLNRVEFSTVLDVCCGTGNQLVKYAARNRNATIIGVDLSPASINTAEKRLKALGATAYKLKAVDMEELFDDPEISTGSFDLISCFYGLYYSRDTAGTLIQMMDHLSDKGSILIVGPHGRNNATLFDIVQRHYALPELVIRSATTFMQREVLPVLSQRLKISAETFVNPVCYPNTKALISYWKASTFYSPAHEKEVVRDIEKHVARHGHFIMEKHVMAYLARKS